MSFYAGLLTGIMLMLFIDAVVFIRWKYGYSFDRFKGWRIHRRYQRSRAK